MSITDRSQPFIICCDMESAPGKAICHFVRFETIIFNRDQQFENTDFQALNPGLDNRVAILDRAMHPPLS